MLTHVFFSASQEDKYWDFTPIFTEIKSQLAAEQAAQVRPGPWISADGLAPP
jgi:hypothetical protein